MRIKHLLTLTTKEQNQIEAFGNFINEICDMTERTNCNPDCIFKDFCSYEKDISYDFLELLQKEFNCIINMDFEN